MDPIGSYCTDLAGRLRLAPGAAERMLEETESHLRDAADAGVAQGLSRAAAEQQALAQFGSVEAVARSANGGLLGLVGRLAFGAAQLGVVGSIAVVAGTLLAELTSRLTSQAWVFGLPDRVVPAASQIAHWVQVQPTAHGWRPAAMMENADDSLLLRSAFCLVAVIGGVIFLRLGRDRLGRVAGPIVPGLGFAAFAAAALVLVGNGIAGHPMLMADWGRGQSFCDAAVALAVAGGCAWRWRRAVRAVAA